MTTSNAGNELSIGMVGYAFMGAAHSQAWRNAPASSTSRCIPG